MQHCIAHSMLPVLHYMIYSVSHKRYWLQNYTLKSRGTFPERAWRFPYCKGIRFIVCKDIVNHVRATFIFVSWTNILKKIVKKAASKTKKVCKWSSSRKHQTTVSVCFDRICNFILSENTLSSKQVSYDTHRIHDCRLHSCQVHLHWQHIIGASITIVTFL